MTLIEVIVAVAIFSIIAVGIVVVMRTVGSEKTAHLARTSLQDEVTVLEARLRKVFAARVNYTIATNGAGLMLTRHGKGTNYGQIFQINYQTSCVPLPAGAALPPTEQATLAALAPCMPCPPGQEPVITVTDSEGGLTQTIPGGSQSAGATQKAMAGGLCPAATAGGVNLGVYMAIVRPDASPSVPRSVIALNHQFFLKTQNAAANVQILH